MSQDKRTPAVKGFTMTTKELRRALKNMPKHTEIRIDIPNIGIFTVDHVDFDMDVLCPEAYIVGFRE